jgi:hypothetical protein
MEGVDAVREEACAAYGVSLLFGRILLAVNLDRELASGQQKSGM